MLKFLQMPSTRKQRAKKNRSRQSNVNSDSENMDLVVTSKWRRSSNQDYFGRRRHSTTLQQAPNQMDTQSRKITSVGRVVRKTCRYCQKHTEETSRKGFTDTSRTPHDPERNRSHSQQQTPNIRGKRRNTFIPNSIDTVTSHQLTNPFNITQPWRRQPYRERPRTHASQSKTIPFGTTTAKYLEQMENRVFEFSKRTPRSQ